VGGKDGSELGVLLDSLLAGVGAGVVVGVGADSGVGVDAVAGVVVDLAAVAPEGAGGVDAGRAPTSWPS